MLSRALAQGRHLLKWHDKKIRMRGKFEWIEPVDILLKARKLPQALSPHLVAAALLCRRKFPVHCATKSKWLRQDTPRRTLAEAFLEIHNFALNFFVFGIDDLARKRDAVILRLLLLRDQKVFLSL